MAELAVLGLMTVGGLLGPVADFLRTGRGSDGMADSPTAGAPS